MVSFGTYLLSAWRVCVDTVAQARVPDWRVDLLLRARYGGRRVRVGRNSDNHTRGYAHVAVAKEHAERAVSELDGTVALRVEPAKGHRDACSIIRLPAGEIHDAHTILADGADQYTLHVSPVSGKVDTLFPSMTVHQRRGIQMDEVAMFSVVDEYAPRQRVV